jgi:hypothetical protein
MPKGIMNMPVGIGMIPVGEAIGFASSIDAVLVTVTVAAFLGMLVSMELLIARS